MREYILELESNFYIFELIMIIVGGIITKKGYKKYRKTKSHQYLNYIPSVWTSFGILGTFISIYLSLKDYTGDTDITKIIHGIIPAFSTSIIGIFMAIATSLYSKYLLTNEEVEEDSTYGKYSDVSPDIVLSQIKDKVDEFVNKYNKINDFDELITCKLEIQTTGLNDHFSNLNTVYVEKVSEIADVYRKHVTNVDNNLVQKLNEIAGLERELYNRHREQIEHQEIRYQKQSDEICKNFASTCTNLSKQNEFHIEQMMTLQTEEKQNQNEYIVGLKNSMCDFVKDMGSKIAVISDNISKENIEIKGSISKLIEEQLNRLDSLYKEIREVTLTETQSFANTVQTKTSEIIEANNLKFNEISEKTLKTSFENIENILLQYKQSLDQTSSSICDSVSENGTIVTKALKSIEEEQKDKLQEILSGNNQFIIDMLAAQNKNYSEIQTKGEEHIKQLNDFFNIFNGKLVSVSNQLDSGYKDHLKRISDGNEKLTLQINSQMQGKFSNLLETQSKIQDKFIQVLSKQYSDFIENNQKNINNISKTSQETSFKTIEELTRLYTDLQSTHKELIKTLESRLVHHTGDFNASLSSSVEEIKKAHKSLEQVLLNFKTHSTHLNEKYDNSVKILEEFNSQIIGLLDITERNTKDINKIILDMPNKN